MIKPVLDTAQCSYNHMPRYLVTKPYSRKSRFFNKCLGLLRCLVNYKLDLTLLKFLKKRKISTPEELFQEIAKYPSKKRRPFDCIMFYWKALGFKQPICSYKDMRILKQDFDNIFFAWSRLGFSNPRFPYSFLFRRIVVANKKRYSDGMLQLTRFVRELRCPTRKKRYEQLFKKCAEFDYKTMQHTPIPDTGLPEQEIIREKNPKPSTISVYDVKNIYRSKKEMDDAIKSGTFDVSKTMHVSKTGKLFFLSYQNDLHLRKLQVSDDEKKQLSQAQKLSEMLREQSML